MTRLKLDVPVLAVLLAASCIPAHAQVSYRLTRIVADPPSAQVFAGDLNDRGEMAGSVQSGGALQALVWRAGTATGLGPLIDPTSTFTDATGNNNRSDVTGSFLDAQLGTFVGFLLRRGEGSAVRIEGLPGATAVFVEDMNNDRQVAGNSFDAVGSSHPFIWERGNSIALPLPAGATSTTVVKINDHGTAVGTSSSEGQRAVIWQDGELVDLGIPDSTGMDLNDRDQVIVWVQTAAGLHSFLWERGVSTQLATLSGEVVSSAAHSINNLGEIVGVTTFPDALAATLWVDGQPVNLNGLIRANDPLRQFVTLERATLINDHGDIVSTGRDSRAPNVLRLYFLTPVR
jgi:hypothetical protein